MPRDRAADPLERDRPVRARRNRRWRTPPAPADPVALLVSELRYQAEETGRLRERLAAAERRAAEAEASVQEAERRAAEAEAAARAAERRRRVEADQADRFVDLLEGRLRAVERDAARLAVERAALGAEFARLWADRPATMPGGTTDAVAPTDEGDEPAPARP